MRLKIYGPPGTGKTDRLKQLAIVAHRNHGDSVLVAALTKAAAVEIRGRSLPIPDNRIGTLHSHGLRALGHPSIFHAHVDLWNDEHQDWLMTAQKKKSGDGEVALAQLEADDGDSSYGNLPGDKALQDYDLIRHRMRPSSLWNERQRAFAKAWEAFKADVDCIDFTDMIDLAFHHCDTPLGHPTAGIFDEVQDFSKLEWALVDKWSTTMESVCLAGDDDQAIFAWRGADPQAFIDFPCDQVDIRDQSYRIPSRVHDLSQRWIHQITNRMEKPFKPRNELGEVRSIPWSFDSRLGEADRLLSDAEQYITRGKTVLFLTACSYMLEPIIVAARQKGIPFENPYKRTNHRWNPLFASRGTSAKDRLLAYLKPDQGTWGHEAHMWTGADVGLWSKPVRANCFVGGRQAVAALEGDEDTSAWIESHLSEDAVDLLELTPSAFERALNQSESNMKPYLFPLSVLRARGGAALRSKPPLMFGTIHSLKGGQADVVYIAPDVSNSGWDSFLSYPDSTIRQFYVGVTRAKESLIVASPRRDSGKHYMGGLIRLAQEAS